MQLETIFIVLLLALIAHPVRRLLLSSYRQIFAAALLFFVGYYVGLTLIRYAGTPEWIKWASGAVFLVEGLPGVLKYFQEISNK
ncbi:hypothetical protein GF406_05485 [candidate division KSB1 bacterium]|nr:hypothetical protein [candidate division KSB1 bacterium]